MTDNLGPGVSRVLSPEDTQYLLTIWQQGKPPTDAALNLMQQIASGAVESSVLRSMPSGFLGNETNSQADFITNPTWSNYFKFGPQRLGEQASVMWANVNGWLIPVTGTRTGTPPGAPNDTDTTNVIALDPPPSNSGDFRIDFAFLEVWKARVQPNPSTTNKPSASTVYRYGNVEGGASYLNDDLIDPAFGFETEQRVQIQYRIRVVSGLVGLTTHPDGFDPVVVKAQGASGTATSFTFENMREELGDAGLWRAGDGTDNDLGTVDGYSYAVPISAVFRRNSVAWNGNPSQNLNGGFNRNPTAVDRTGIATFSTVPTLAADLAAGDLSATLVSGTNIPMPASPSSAVTIQIGDEVMTYASITGTTVNTLTRAQNGTLAQFHPAGTPIRVVTRRPDGLYADQIAFADILDLRHVVNPNGADYTALLKSNVDKLLRGRLRANWKRSGGGPQGTFVHYQDAIQSAAVSLGVTQLDAPDNIRTVFSDAATIQPIECVVRPNSGDVPPGPVDINESWSLSLTVQTTNQTVANQFTAGDVIVVPVNQLKSGFQAGATDQVRWMNDGVTGAVQLRLAGETGDLDPSMYTITPAVPGPNDNLTITLSGSFPTQLSDLSSPRQLHIRVHAVYGAGRGLSRRPDALHSISYLNPSSTLMSQQWGIPDSNLGAKTSWAPLWSKYRNGMYNGLLPAISEMYADLGSKTVVVTPFRRIEFPDLLTVDGDAANPVASAKHTSNTGEFPSENSITLEDSFGTGPTVAGDALVIPSGPGAGRYTVVSVGPSTYTLDRPIRAKDDTGINYTIHDAQGVMPLNAADGITPKWTTTDPLNLFCGSQAGNAAFNSLYVNLPRHLVPGWGELNVPIQAADGDFASGVNYMVRDTPGTVGEAQFNYVAYSNTSVQYSVFAQEDNTATTITYNTAQSVLGNQWAGMRFFTDTRGLNRSGLELPPFYGIARLFGVYEVSDYIDNGSPFSDERESGGGGTAVNLLRQSMRPEEGPVVWIETDSDGDSTFILNANAVDLARSPVAIADFTSGSYVIEAAVFGFDRNSFNLDSEFRLVLTRPDLNFNAWTNVGNGTVDQTPTIPGRANNVNKRVTGPSALLPGPATASEQILINYSRTPYQGDAWGSQTNYIDIPYEPGPLTSSTAYEISSTELDAPENLARPNEKVLEVLASLSFSTTLGTGRYSGDVDNDLLNFTQVAYSDPDTYPPLSAVDPRPLALPNAYADAYAFKDDPEIGTEYLGCTERLPMGALYRDKDFIGQSFSLVSLSPLFFSETVGIGGPTGLSGPAMETLEAPLNTATSGVAGPGELLVHVDGEQGNYSLTDNFRVNRGGSVYVASGPHPGGALNMSNSPNFASSDHTHVLHARALLVRNTVTNVGANEVSAGNELMLLVITNHNLADEGGSSRASIVIGTNGAGEGTAAADLYRIEGHPLVKNNVKLQLDPSTIQLVRKA